MDSKSEYIELQSSNRSARRRLGKLDKRLLQDNLGVQAYPDGFSRTIWVSWHQKGKLTILDFNKVSDDRAAVASVKP